MKKLIRFTAFLALASSVTAHDLRREINLEGEWRFEIGDNMAYANPAYDDSKWELINVPSAWENEGFPGYDGFAWYRYTFKAPANMSTKHLYLKLGRIDDVDRTFLNGHALGGKGSFPPNFKTAYDSKRLYAIPPGILKPGRDNTLAVRVYDHHGGGGIVDGSVGIYSRSDVVELMINLSGLWKFATGDKAEWRRYEFDDSRWNKIKVPAYWQEQGYPDYHGTAYYRRKVMIPASLAKSKLILMLGKINDNDEVYFNGTRIGNTGQFPKPGSKKRPKGHKDDERAYFIPPSLIRPNQLNLIAVRVFDLGRVGGIYEGYVGITTRAEYLKYSKKRK